MRTLKLTLAYDGTAYAGWQWQPERRTLQGILEQALEKLTGEASRVLASGRTDAGVHALGQVVKVRTSSHLAVDVFQRAINAHLPPDVVVLSVEDQPATFHPIRQVRRKRYRYQLVDGPVREIFARQFAWYCHGTLDVAAMQQAALALIGRHDFRSFETNWPNRQTSVRTVYELSIERQPQINPQLIYVEIEADGFLYNMVRTIVGTLVRVGWGEQRVEWPGEVLAAQNRSAAGMTAPPQGLFLLRVEYDPPPPVAATAMDASSSAEAGETEDDDLIDNDLIGNDGNLSQQALEG